MNWAKSRSSMTLMLLCMILAYQSEGKWIQYLWIAAAILWILISLADIFYRGNSNE